MAATSTPRPKRKVTKGRSRFPVTASPGESLEEKSARGRKRLEEMVSEEADREIPVESDETYEASPINPETIGNSLWKEAFKRYPKGVRGSARMVKNVDELLAKAKEYFEWAESNPLRAAKIYSTQRGLRHTTEPRMRALTIEGLCVFLGISRDTWNMWGRESEHPDLSDGVWYVNYLIREQKFTGAAADLLNANIISRDLGLADKQEVSGPDGGPLEVSARDILADRLDKLAATLSGGSAGSAGAGTKKG